MSQLDRVEAVLGEAGAPLHVEAILEKVRERHGVALDRETIVSAITKNIARGRRFVRTAPNTFDLRKGESS